MTTDKLPRQPKSIKICSITGCEKKVIARGYCHAHWKRNHLHGDPLGGHPIKTTKENFWARVIKRESGCWDFPTTYERGIESYGRVSYRGRRQGAHRLAFFFHHGREAEGLVLHSCDNRRCVNPAHLREGNHRDNTCDAVERGRARIGSRHPSAKLSEEGVREIRRLHDAGYSIRRLARMYNMTYSPIQLVVRRLTWKHVK